MSERFERESVYGEDDKGLTLERVLYAFQTVLGIPRGIVQTPFKRHLYSLIQDEYPRFRCSALRAVLEGRIPGIPKPVEPIHPQWRKKVQQALYLLDLCETIVHKHIEEKKHAVKNKETGTYDGSKMKGKIETGVAG